LTQKKITKWLAEKEREIWQSKTKKNPAGKTETGKAQTETANTYKNGQKISKLKNNTLTYYFKSGKKKAKGKFINNKFEGHGFFTTRTANSFRKATLPITKKTASGNALTNMAKSYTMKCSKTERN
jgi:hypothetical protein